MMWLSGMKGSIAVTILMMMVSIFVHDLVRCAAPIEQPVPPPPAIFVFGDGTMDIGNNNDLTGGEMGDPPRANHPYYGIDFPGEPQNTNGRFSNGYNIADFIAKALGFVMSPPAYASLANPSPTRIEGFTGVNYASADAGIRDSTNGNMTIPLPMQVNNFVETRAQLKAVLGGRKPLNKFLSKSLFLIGVGTMDLLPNCNFYLELFPINDNKTEVQRLIEFYGADLEKLHSMGARKFAIINVGPIGCSPFVQNDPARNGGCDDGMNRLAGEFNAALGSLLSDLGTRLHNFRYTLADFYGFSNATFANPLASGFTNIDTACCPGACAPTHSYWAPCYNRPEYWFWDEGYTTEQADKLAAVAFYNGTVFARPVNIRRLIAMKG
ncbi:hypothetical protein HU200_004132 [Digitaria exilis]|uniref:GDSL esterase/lipase n=1 Tax=Digitaria exilis TaxID=1010633 RepID=A0A835FWF8_9POAL|nr:hypothetical protein HU200_004132 [Digitaria exilis]